MKVTDQKVLDALESLEKGLEANEAIEKASAEGLDQPEGDPIDPAQKGKKLSDKAPGPDAKKSMAAEEGEDYDDEDVDSDNEVMMSKKSKGKDCKKSFGESAPQEIKTKVEVSEFLKSLVAHTGKSIDKLTDEISKSQDATVQGYNTLANSIAEIQKSQGKIGTVLKALCEHTGMLEKSAARAPKAETTLAKSQVAERSFENTRTETPAKEENGLFKSLSGKSAHEVKKSITDAMCDLVMKGEASDLDVINFETYGSITPEVTNKLKTVFN